MSHPHQQQQQEQQHREGEGEGAAMVEAPPSSAPVSRQQRFHQQHREFLEGLAQRKRMAQEETRRREEREARGREMLQAQLLRDRELRILRQKQVTACCFACLPVCVCVCVCVFAGSVEDPQGTTVGGSCAACRVRENGHSVTAPPTTTTTTSLEKQNSLVCMLVLRPTTHSQQQSAGPGPVDKGNGGESPPNPRVRPQKPASGEPHGEAGGVEDVAARASAQQQRREKLQRQLELHRRHEEQIRELTERRLRQREQQEEKRRREEEIRASLRKKVGVDGVESTREMGSVLCVLAYTPRVDRAACCACTSEGHGFPPSPPFFCFPTDSERKRCPKKRPKSVLAPCRVPDPAPAVPWWKTPCTPE